MFKGINDLQNDETESRGIIRLWAKPNYISSKWSTAGNFGTDIYSFFFIPNMFLYSAVDTFEYNFPFVYVNRSEKVSGVTHTSHGDRWLDQGKTADFWHLEPQELAKVTLMTDEYTKLPYLIKPNRGEPTDNQEKCYFIPCSGSF